MMWCILYMMAYPEIQSRVQAELDHVVGRNHLPRLDDLDKVPYTNAVLLEVRKTFIYFSDYGEFISLVKWTKSKKSFHFTRWSLPLYEILCSTSDDMCPVTSQLIKD